MAGTYSEFDKRLRTIQQRNQKKRHGSNYRVGADGLIAMHPRKRSPRFPIKGIALLVAAGFAFKVFLYMNLGGATFEQRVSELANGTLVEQAGAWIMQPDPVTLMIVDQLRPYFI